MRQSRFSNSLLCLLLLVCLVLGELSISTVSGQDGRSSSDDRSSRQRTTDRRRPSASRDEITQEQRARAFFEAIRRAQSRDMDENQRNQLQELLNQAAEADPSKSDQAEMMKRMMQQMSGRGSMMGNLGAGRSKSKPSTSESKVLKVNLQLAKLGKITSGNVEHLRDILSEVDGLDLADLADELGEEFAAKLHNELVVTAVVGSKSEITLGEQVAVRSGSSMTRSGQKTTSYNYQDVGMRVEVLPLIKDGVTQLQVEINKSFVDTPKSDSKTDQLPTIKTFECRNVFSIEPGNGSTIMITNGEDSWLLSAFVN